MESSENDMQRETCGFKSSIKKEDKINVQIYNLRIQEKKKSERIQRKWKKLEVKSEINEYKNIYRKYF